MSSPGIGPETSAPGIRSETSGLGIRPETWPAGLRWVALLALSAAAVAGLEAARLPAALLLGPMLAAMSLAGAEAPVRPPAPVLMAAQAVVGCMIANSIPTAMGGELARHWPVSASGVLSVVLVATALGYVLARLRVLDGSTAVWGSMPGAATAMTLMAADFGADIRLVALMQYLRVFCVTVASTMAARLAGVRGTATPAAHWLSVPAAGPLAATLLLLAVAGVAGARSRISAGALILPMIAGIAWKATGLPILLPMPLLAASYAVIGWFIGHRFTGTVLRQALRVLPRVLASILLLIGLCAGLALALHRTLGTDLLTAYLATSPGGADSVAIIAASVPVDVPFVMTMQVGRFLTMLVLGPMLARFVARRVGRNGAPTAGGA
ncbi:AbrB family transcriptional regulator [Rhizosaccharibacter radicis]|uniref:AbrB family transcriptional regulator n=1 Tax=Rhizosaccharibacter radicis TaxID=2782605 RepID=A0ABT1VUK2_9PROT|nr:AbrB family transcriptional regulator [Acetobacteraceae bacterium KSS12]